MPFFPGGGIRFPIKYAQLHHYLEFLRYLFYTRIFNFNLSPVFNYFFKYFINRSILYVLFKNKNKFKFENKVKIFK